MCRITTVTVRTTALPPEDFVPVEHDLSGGQLSHINAAAADKATTDACITSLRLVKVQDVELYSPCVCPSPVWGSLSGS